MPIALSPTPDSYDSYGTFTGSVLPDGEGASVIYTGVTKVPTEQETIRNEGLKEVQCIAVTNDPDLRTWHHLPNPVVEHPPAGMKITGFRDPFSWKEGDTWYLGVGSGVGQTGGMVLLYRSKNARNWEYLHPLAQGTWNGEVSSNPVPSGEMWECPDFFALGEKHVLLYSTEHKTFWEVGTFDRHELRFHSERKGLLDQGAYYAPKSMLDEKGRRILWGWVQETRSPDETKAAGWGGSMSLPRVLTVSSDNELRMAVPPEFASLRAETSEIKGPLKPDKLDRALSKVALHNRSAEVICAFKPGEKECGLELRLQTTSGVVPLLAFTCGIANGHPTLNAGDKVVPLNLDKNGVSILHVWIDGSVIEAFVDEKQVITTRCYQAPTESGEIHLAWSGVAEAMKSLTTSAIKPISGDRLTS